MKARGPLSWARVPIRFRCVALLFSLRLLDPTTEAAAQPIAVVPRSPTTATLVFVSNEASKDLSILNAGGDVLATVPLGARARGIHASADGRRVYIALSDDRPNETGSNDAIAVVDVSTRRVIARLPSGSDPEQFAVSPDDRFLYASNEDAGTASVISLKRGQLVTTLLVGIEPEGVAISLDGRFVAVTAETSNSVSIINTRTNQVVANVLVDLRPRGVAFAPNSRTAFVSAEIGSTLSVLDVPSGTVRGSVSLERGEGKPVGVAVSPDGNRVYVANGATGIVAVVDPHHMRVVNRIPVGKRPWGIALSRDGTRLFVANGLSDEISIIDAATEQVIASVKVGHRPWGVAVVEGTPIKQLTKK